MKNAYRILDFGFWTLTMPRVLTIDLVLAKAKGKTANNVINA